MNVDSHTAELSGVRNRLVFQAVCSIHHVAYISARSADLQASPWEIYNPRFRRKLEKMTIIPHFSFAQLTVTRHFLRALLCVAAAALSRKSRVTHKNRFANFCTCIETLSHQRRRRCRRCAHHSIVLPFLYQLLVKRRGQ